MEEERSLSEREQDESDLGSPMSPAVSGPKRLRERSLALYGLGNGLDIKTSCRVMSFGGPRLICGFSTGFEDDFEAHLRDEHGINLEEDEEEEGEGKWRKTESCPDPPSERWPVGSESARRFTVELAMSLVRDNIPVSLFKNKTVRRLLRKQSPLYPLRALEQIHEIIKEMGVECIAVLKDVLATLSCYAVTTHSCESQGDLSLRYVTVHFVQADSFQLCSHVVALQYCHDEGNGIADFVACALTRVGLDLQKCVAVTGSGSGSRLGKMRQVASIGSWLSRCEHMLLNVDVLSCSRLREAISVAKTNAQRLAEVHVFDVEVKYRSLFGADRSAPPFPWEELAKSVLRQTVAHRELLCPIYSSSTTLKPITEADFSLLAQFDEWLHPLQKLTELVNESEGMDMGTALGLVWYTCFRVFFEESERDAVLDPSVRQLKTRYRKEIGKHLMSNYEKCAVSHAALLLHPFWKRLHVPPSVHARFKEDDIIHFFSDCAARAKPMVVALLEEFDLCDLPQAVASDAQPPLPHLFREHVAQLLVGGATPVQRSASAELRAWLDEPLPSAVEGMSLDCALNFWGSPRALQFPRLRELARRLLAVHASLEAASDRVSEIAKKMEYECGESIDFRAIISLNKLKRDTK